MGPLHDGPFAVIASLMYFTVLLGATSLDDARVSRVASAVLAEHGTQGCFLLYDEQTHAFLRHNPARTRLAVSPASTSKILHSLVALEEAVFEDEHQVIAWDGVERDYSSWNRDQTLASALRYSAVWVYQHIARQVGRAGMQGWLDRVGYGNGRIGGRVDHYWLDGSLTITPEQQVHFLRRLQAGDLPFSEHNQDIVRHIMTRESVPGAVLRAKTGWAINQDPDVGWYVGWLEVADRRWFFALNVDLYDDGRGRDRHGMAMEIFEQLGLLPAPSG